MMRFIPAALAAVLCLGAAAPRIVQGAALPARKTRTVVLIVSDGLRWQEICNGAEADLLNDKEGGSWLPSDELRRRYWRPGAAERGALLVPFLGGTGAEAGHCLGTH